MDPQNKLMDAFNEYMAFRKGAGYSTANYVSQLVPFIDYCNVNFPGTETVTQEMVDGWIKKRSTELHAKSQASLVGVIRQFSRFLCFLGMGAFIPDDEYKVHYGRYYPHLFTDTELEKLFDCFDSWKPNPYRPKIRAELVNPVLFRMLYCCGMRPAEPLHLLYRDINLESGDIYIRETKNKKERHIIMSEDLKNLCVSYNRIINDDGRTWFFEHDGGPYSIYWLGDQFRRCWKQLGISASVSPRPYDLRHAFATRNLMRWVDEKRDVMVLIPFLSAYMGHVRISETLYYVHLLPERLRKSSGVDWSQFSAIYGKDGGMVET